MWRYYILRVAVALMAPLPSWIGDRVAALLGDFAYVAGRRSRARLQENLRRVLGKDVGERALRRVTRACFRNLGRNYYDLIRIPRFSPQKLNRCIEFVGFERLEEALGRGKGVVLATAHLGNMDLVAQAAVAHAIPMTVLVERFQPEKLWQYCMKLRMAQGMSVHPAGPRGVKAAFRALRQGGAVAIACDRAIHGVGITTSFMGEPAVMPVGAVELALRTGAVLLPAFCLRTGRDRCRVSIEPPVPMNLNGHRPTDEDVREAVDRFIAVMERYIRSRPDQWMLFQPLWEAPAGNGVERAGATVGVQQ